jgi:hypothetical protein
MPAFDTAYSASEGDGSNPWIDEVVMIADPGFRCGEAALVIQKSG